MGFLDTQSAQTSINITALSSISTNIFMCYLLSHEVNLVFKLLISDKKLLLLYKLENINAYTIYLLKQNSHDSDVIPLFSLLFAAPSLSVSFNSSGQTWPAK